MNKDIIKTRHLIIYPIGHQHLNFLLRLWNDPEIMRYAGSERNWSYNHVNEWYGKYKERVKHYGNTEVHFIIKLKSGRVIGESGLGRLRKGWSCSHYNPKKDKLVVMTDVKLIKPFWNMGYGTEAMKAIVRYVFENTNADIFLVPPHRDNVPAVKVYENACFKRTKGVYYRYHIIYQMRRKDYSKLYE